MLRAREWRTAWPRRHLILHLEDLPAGALVARVLPDAPVTVVNLEWHGSEVVTLTYRVADGAVAEKLLFREDEPRLTLVEEGRPWSFDGDGDAFRLASEAKRISLVCLFDAYVAVSTPPDASPGAQHALKRPTQSQGSPDDEP